MVSDFLMQQTATHLQLQYITERLNELENKVFGNKRKENTTRAQQMLILHYTGVLRKLGELNLPNTKLSEMLGIMLNASPENIRKDLSDINNPKSTLRTEDNYSFILDIFKEAGLTELANTVQKELDKIRQEEEI